MNIQKLRQNFRECSNTLCTNVKMDPTKIQEYDRINRDFVEV